VTITPALITHHFQMDQQAMEVLKRCEEVGNHHYEVIWYDRILHTVGKQHSICISICIYIYIYIYIQMCVFSNIPWDWPGNLGTYHKAFQKKKQQQSIKKRHGLIVWLADAAGCMLREVDFSYWSYSINLYSSIQEKFNLVSFGCLGVRYFFPVFFVVTHVLICFPQLLSVTVGKTCVATVDLKF